MSWSKGHRLHAGGNWVDDRDVATAHVNAIVTEAAGGERFIVASARIPTKGLLTQSTTERPWTR
ncbi:hypothetical protein JB92DRAFT_2869602, partial [Gautieria morchelliformis]